MTIRLGQMESLIKSDPEILPHLPPAGISLASASPALDCVHTSPDQTWFLLLLKAGGLHPWAAAPVPALAQQYPAVPTTPHLPLSSDSSREQGL